MLFFNVSVLIMNGETAVSYLNTQIRYKTK